MKCPNCGFEEEEGSEFCGNCGYSFTAPPPSQEQIPAPPSPPYPPPGGEWGTASQPPVPPVKKSKLVPVLVTICALLLIGVVVLVLMLTVFKGEGEKEKGEKATSEPTAVAEAYLKAIEDRDLDALLALLDPDFLKDLEDDYGKEYEDILESFFFGSLPEDLEFSGLKFSQEVKGDQAEVFIEEGEATYLDEDGEKVTDDLAETMEDSLEVEQRDGKWYITMGGFEDWEDYLADYGAGENENGHIDDGDGNLNNFESPLLGLGFSYPDGWTPQEYSEGLIEVKPIGAEDKATVTFYTEDFSGMSYSVDDWIASETGELDDQGWPYEVSYTTVDVNPAAQIVFSYLGEQSLGYKVMDTFMFSGSTGYYVSYIALEEDFDGYLDAAQGMIDSLYILR
jgi:hypothetical protein